MTKTKVSFLNKIESSYFSGVYQILTSDKQIRSEISYVKEDGVIILTSKIPEKYESIWKVKSHDKAINLLMRAEKDFIRHNKNCGVPMLRTIEKNYKNYFTEEVENYTAPWDK